MKKIAALLALLFGAHASATEYRCESLAGTSAMLRMIEGSSIEWFDLSHSAASLGLNIDIENAPFSEWNGYQQYQLTDFYRTDDSRYVLAVQSREKSPMKAVVYFESDDHPEEIEEFNCFRN